jgi:hypothetical protein
MMDIKYFHDKGLIELSDGVYKGVVGVTADSVAYANAMEGEGRPEYMYPHNINDLLVRPRKGADKEFLEHFPFNVINLDYCNSLFFNTRDPDAASLQSQAIERVFDKQRSTKIRRFVLLVTTLAEREEVADHFLENLTSRIDYNIANNSQFKKIYNASFGEVTGQDLLVDSYEDFAPLGIVKFIADLATTNGFKVIDCETASLVRDRRCRSGHPARWLLHVAFLLGRPTENDRRKLKNLGNTSFLERNVYKYLEYRQQDTLLSVSETENYNDLQEQHGKLLERLASESFEISIPEPES